MKKHSVNTHLSEIEVIMTLKNLINTQNDKYYFNGEIHGNSFTIAKHRYFTNKSLTPHIRGEIIKTQNGTTIEFYTTVGKGDKISMVFAGILSAFMFCFLIIYGIISRTNSVIAPISVFLGFEAFFVLTEYLLFRFKSNRVVLWFAKFIKNQK